MTDELKFPNPLERRAARDAGSLDERTAQAIHDLYMPPVAKGDDENAYWSALEQRIMSGVKAGKSAQRDHGWLSVLNGWSHVGLAAAAALFVVGGFVSNSLGEPAEEQVASEMLIPSSTLDAISTPASLITATDNASLHDATLQYVLSY